MEMTVICSEQPWPEQAAGEKILTLITSIGVEAIALPKLAIKLDLK